MFLRVVTTYYTQNTQIRVVITLAGRRTCLRTVRRCIPSLLRYSVASLLALLLEEGDLAPNSSNSQTVFDDHGTYRCVYDPHSEYEYTPDDENVGRLTKSMGAYHVLEQLTRANTLPDEQSKFFARRQDMRRAQLRSEGRRVSYWFAEAQNAIFRHGESFSRVIGWSLGTIVAFAFIYPLGGWLQSDSTGTITYGTVTDIPGALWQSFHHSSLLFLTGGGPLSPTGFIGELLITIEAMMAPILLALLIFVLGRRAAR
jgi:hypothetical protein